MKPSRAPLRAPVLFAALLVLAGVGYASYTAAATTTVTASSASFEIVFETITDPPLPANVAIAVSPLPAVNPTLTIATLLGGQTIYINYTVEDIGTIAAHGVTELPSEKSSGCDGDLSIAQVGPGPTSLSPGVPAHGEFSLTDNLPPGPIPGDCPDPFSAVWTFTVTGTPV